MLGPTGLFFAIVILAMLSAGGIAYALVSASALIDLQAAIIDGAMPPAFTVAGEPTIQSGRWPSMMRVSCGV